MKKFILFLFILLLSATVSCDNKKGTNTDFFAMNTYVSVYTDVENNAVHSEIMDLVKTLEKRLSRTFENSDIYKIHDDSFLPHKTTMDLLLLAKDISEKTSGAFDFTLGTITSLWDITGENPTVPTEEQIKVALSHSGYEKTYVEEDKLCFSDKNIKVDLGAIAKGYIGNQIISLIKKNKIENASVSIGGNIFVLGSSNSNTKDGKNGWNIAINNPFDTSEIIGTITLSDTTISVSGSYERFFEKDGQKYHHIFSSKTGKPANSDIASVAVISENGALADSLSTALFVMGYEKAIEFYNSNIYDFDAVFVLCSGDVFVTDNILNSFTPNKNAKKGTSSLFFKQYTEQ